MSTGSLPAPVVLAIAVKLQQMLTDPATPDRTVSVPITPYVYQAAHLQFTGARDTTQENTLAEFSDLVNRIPTTPVWKPQPSVHLWDIYGELLGAQLAQDSLSPQEKAEYDTAQAYLYDTVAADAREPSAALTAYRDARQAWLQASIDYRQAEAASATADDPAVRTHWQDVDEPKLRQLRDDAATAWSVNGHKEQVDEALRTLTELGARSPSAVWRRHRDTFNPNLADQFNTSPNGIRFAPTFFAPGDVLDAPWPRVQLPREALLGLASTADTELTALLGDDIGDQLQSVSFDYCVVSISRPWLDPVTELFSSRSWKLPEGTQELSDGGDPPRGRCPSYVETAALVRNIDTAFATPNTAETVSTGDHGLVAPGATFDLDTGFTNGETPDFKWEKLTDIEGGFNLVPLGGARVMELGWPGDRDPLGGPVPNPSFDDIGPRELNDRSSVWRGENTPIKFGGAQNADGVWIHPDRYEAKDGFCFAVLTAAGNLAKVQIVDFGEAVHLRWVTYKGSSAVPAASNKTDPQDIYVAAVVCRTLPRCPDPDPNLLW